MKKITITIFACLIILSFASCGNTDYSVNVNVEKDTSIDGNVFGKAALIEIGDNLWYDSTTRIVYWWNSWLRGEYATTPSPYYAPNGLPYRYNPETNTFEDIKENL